MSFTYDFTANLLLSQVRMLVPDTDATHPIFNDDEVNQALYLTSSQGLYVAAQAAAGGSNRNTTPLIYSVRMAAALLIDALASNKAKLAVVEQILDVKIDPSRAQKALHEQAECLRDQERKLGSFAIAEVVTDSFSARERWYAQILRIEGA